MLRFLFYRNGFRQVSRFIHIEASADRYVVAKELQWNDCQGICKNRICLRQVNYVVGYFSTSVLPTVVTAMTNAPRVFTS